MFKDRPLTRPDFTLACSLNESGFSFVAIKENNRVLFSHTRKLDTSTSALLAQALTETVDEFNLIAMPCHLILDPSQYQLILLDTLEAKSIRENIRGLSEYPLEDAVMDTFMLPSAAGERQNKVFVAITPLSVLKTKLALFTNAFLDVTEVTIADLAMNNLLTLILSKTTREEDAPIIFIYINNNIRKLYIVYQNNIYFIRDLVLQPGVNPDESLRESLLLEIERCIDYCVSQINLPEPKKIFLTPNFQQKEEYKTQIMAKFKLDITVIDLNDYLQFDPPLNMDDQQHLFYTISGAINLASTSL